MSHGEKKMRKILARYHTEVLRAPADFINEMLRDIVPEETFAISSNIGSRRIIILKRYTAAINYTWLLCIRYLLYVLTRATMLARRLFTNYADVQKAAPLFFTAFL